MSAALVLNEPRTYRCRVGEEASQRSSATSDDPAVIDCRYSRPLRSIDPVAGGGNVNSGGMVDFRKRHHLGHTETEDADCDAILLMAGGGRLNTDYLGFTLDINRPLASAVRRGGQAHEQESACDQLPITPRLLLTEEIGAAVRDVAGAAVEHRFAIP